MKGKKKGYVCDIIVWFIIWSLWWFIFFFLLTNWTWILILKKKFGIKSIFYSHPPIHENHSFMKYPSHISFSSGRWIIFSIIIKNTRGKLWFQLWGLQKLTNVSIHAFCFIVIRSIWIDIIRIDSVKLLYLILNNKSIIFINLIKESLWIYLCKFISNQEKKICAKNKQSRNRFWLARFVIALSISNPKLSDC